jgi:hypothetical protein
MFAGTSSAAREVNEASFIQDIGLMDGLLGFTKEQLTDALDSD